MRSLFLLIFLVAALGYSRSSYAQVDSTKLLKTQRQIEKNKREVDQMNRSIAREEKRAKKQERAIERKEKNRNKQLKKIRKQEQQLEKMKKDTIN